MAIDDQRDPEVPAAHVPTPFGQRQDRWYPFEGLPTVTEAGVEYRSQCPDRYHAGPLVAHGGWTAAAMDELCGAAANQHPPFAVTGGLSVRFVRPVPVERDLVLRARVERQSGRRRYVTGEILLASSGAMLATAEGVFVERDPAHFARHQEWLRTQEAAGEA